MPFTREHRLQVFHFTYPTYRCSVLKGPVYNATTGALIDEAADGDRHPTRLHTELTVRG